MKRGRHKDNPRPATAPKPAAPKPPPPPTGPLAYLEVLFGTMAAAITGLLYSGFFTSRDYLPPLLAAAGGAALLAVLTAVRRWRAASTLLVAVLGFALLAVFLVYRHTLDHGVPTVRTATDLGSGLLRGWARMLSVGLPADVTQELLITPALLTWVAAFVSTTLSLRTRAILAPALPTLLALVTGLLLTAARPAAGAMVTGAYLVVTLLLVVVRVSRLETAVQPDAEVVSPGPVRRRLIGRIAFGIPVALLVTAIGVGGAQVVPVAAGTQRFDPRTVTPQRYNVDDTLTPLATLKAQLETPARQLFTVRVTDDGGQTLDRVRTAALDDFDGALWTADDSFLVAGHTLPADPNLAHRKQVAARIEVQDLTGPYLPVLGWPVRIGTAQVGGAAAGQHSSETGLGFCASSGVLVGPGAGLRGTAYDLVGEVPVDDGGLKAAVPNLSGAAGRDTRLPPGLPVELDTEARRLTAQATTPYAKLIAIQDYLRKLPYSLGARPGHSYDALRRLFSTNAQDRAAYAEQFAAAFAVLARAQGFPTRVAVGYLLRTKQGDAYAVSTADAHAWAEVDLAGYGWVAFDPTDPSHRASTSTPPPPTDATAPNKPEDPQQVPGQQPYVDPGLKAGPGTRAQVIAGTVIGAIALVVVALLLLIGIAVEKVRRRYRRRMGSGNQRIVGAWQEVTDRLVERGVPVPRSLTAIEAAAHAEEHLGEPARSVAVLAPMVTAAVFYPGEPLEDNVRDAWDLSGQFRRDLRRSRGFLRAVRAWFDPRPLMYAWRDRRRLRGALKELQEG
jgi:transglutaminase-like putative cysteine protease